MAKARKKTASKRTSRPEPALKESWSDADAAEAWVEGLQESLPGVVFLDRDLELDRRLAVELAGVDGSGRLVLVALSEGGPEELARVGELFAFVRRHTQVLVRHLNDARLDAGAAPRVVLVLASLDEPLAWRFAPLLEQGLEVACLRTIKSSGRGGGRERVYLVPADAHGPAEVGLVGDGREGFLDALDAPREELAASLLTRLERADDELERTMTRRAASFRFRGVELLRLATTGGRLVAELPPDPRPRPLEDPTDVERLLDEVMDALLERVDPLSGEEVRTAPPRGADASRDPRPGPGGTHRVQDEPRGHGPSGVWDAAAGLLTPEEIEAFRE